MAHPLPLSSTLTEMTVKVSVKVNPSLCVTNETNNFPAILVSDPHFLIIVPVMNIYKCVIVHVHIL